MQKNAGVRYKTDYETKKQLIAAASALSEWSTAFFNLVIGIVQFGTSAINTGKEVSLMNDYEKLVQRIKNSSTALLYLKLCYLDEIDTDSFQEKLTDCCYRCGVREKEAYAMYYATRLLEDLCREEIMRKIEEIEARQ